MSNPFDDPDSWTNSSGSTKKKVIVMTLIAAIIVGVIAVGPYTYFYFKSTATNNCTGSTTPPPGFGVSASTCPKLGISITYQGDLFPRMNMLQQGYTPNCWAFCIHGITYSGQG